MIYLLHQTITIALPESLSTFEGIRLFYPSLYKVIKIEEQQQKEKAFEISERLEWISD
jgi:hypothetical protein